MKKIQYLTIPLFLAFTLLVGQDISSVAWFCESSQINSEFIDAYREQLKVSENYEELRKAPMKDDRLLVKVDISGDTIKLAGLWALDYNGEKKRLGESFYNQLEPSLTDKLVKREYEWREWDYQDKMLLQFYGDVINVLQRKNYKATRDKFWWTFREFDLSSSGRNILRPKYFPFAIFTDRGMNEIGFGGSLSNTLSFGIINEIGKYYLVIPWNSTLGIINNNMRPLDGVYGTGISFDTHKIGGGIQYQNPEINLESLELHEGGNTIVYSKWSTYIYYSGSFGTPGKSKNISNFNTPGSKTRKLIDAGTFRIKAGITYQELNIGTRIDSTYIEESSSSLLESLRGYIRGEFVTDDNKHNIYIQVNPGSAQNSIHFGLSTAMLGVEWIRLGFDSSYHTSYDFNNGNYSYEWNPGWQLRPFVTLNF